jgi:hypothetical protein
MTWRKENSWPHWDSNSDPLVVQPVTSRYNIYDIPAPTRAGKYLKFTSFKIKVIHVNLWKIVIWKVRGLRIKYGKKKKNIPCVKGKMVSELNYVLRHEEELSGNTVPHISCLNEVCRSQLHFRVSPGWHWTEGWIRAGLMTKRYIIATTEYRISVVNHVE